jgi:acyl carrier protein phosphodiesterase
MDFPRKRHGSKQNGLAGPARPRRVTLERGWPRRFIRANRQGPYAGRVNFLAHLYLARHSDDAMLGALLGDFVGTAGLERYGAEVQREILLHRKIDSFTDRHPEVLHAKRHFPEGRRRYAGILLDVYFDHLLARHWHRHHGGDLDAFTTHFYGVLLANLPALPPRLQRIAPIMAARDWLGSYRDRDVVDHAVTGIATRLSRNSEKLVECLPILRRHERDVEQRFQAFFPQLQAYVQQTRPEACEKGDGGS